MSPLRPLTRFPATVALSLATALWPTAAVAGTNSNGGDGYRIGDEVPVSCLNRTLYVILLPILEAQANTNQTCQQRRRTCMRLTLNKQIPSQLTTKQIPDHRQPRQTPIHPLRNLQRDIPPTIPPLWHLRNNHLHHPRALRHALPPLRVLRALRRPNDLSRTHIPPLLNPKHT